MHLIYQTANGKVLQSDLDNHFTLSFKNLDFRFNICGLIAFKSKISTVDVSTKLLSSELCDDLEIFSMCNNERLMVLTMSEIVEMRDLLSGTFAMMELNSILHQRIYRVLA